MTGPRWLPPPRPFIAYQKAPADQGELIEAFARAAPRGPQVIGWHVEAPGPDRAELAKALEAATRNRAVLILATLDHIAGDAVALAAIQQSGVEFIACDQPTVSRDALAELLASAISLDRHNSPPAEQPVAARSVREAIRDIQRSGASNLRAICKALQERGFKTPTGRTTWQPTQVARVLAAEKPPAQP
jgi:hypothetical protein